MKNETGALQAATLDPSAYWMPFTHNRYFKKHPASRTLVRAEGAYYTNAEGRRLFDGLSGLWCTPLGHAHPHIAEAVAAQVTRARLQSRRSRWATRRSIRSPRASPRSRATGWRRCSSPIPGPRRSTPRSRSRSPTTA